MLVAISMAGIVAAGARIFASWWRTRRLTAQWMRGAELFELPGSELPAFKIEHPFPVLAVIGVLHPKIFVASQVLEALSPSELSAAMSHEIGHIRSRDNFKRLAMRLCGDMLVLPLGKTLDREWLEAAESAADEFAAADAAHALDLASALVNIGRITPAGHAWEMPAGAYLTWSPTTLHWPHASRILSALPIDRVVRRLAPAELSSCRSPSCNSCASRLQREHAL